jgi:lipopolysaccharide export system permease protein
MGILTRYLIRSHAGPFFFALSTLTGLLFLNSVAQRMARLAGKGLGTEVFVDFLLLTLPHVVALTLPMAVLVSVLYTLSDLSSGNEITAMAAGGVRPRTILTPLLVAGTVLGGVMYYFNDQILPESNHQLQTLMLDIGAKRPTFALREQYVNEVKSGVGSATYFLQADQIDGTNNELTGVLIHDLTDLTRHRTIEAERGTMALTAAGTDLILTLYNGTIHQVSDRNPGEYQRIGFTRQTFAMEGVADQLERRGGRDIRSDREMTVAMLRREIDCVRQEEALLGEESYRRSRHAVQVALLLPVSPDSMIDPGALVSPCLAADLEAEAEAQENTPDGAPAGEGPGEVQGDDGGAMDLQLLEGDGAILGESGQEFDATPDAASDAEQAAVDSLVNAALEALRLQEEDGVAPPQPDSATWGAGFASFPYGGMPFATRAARQSFPDLQTQVASGNVRSAMLRAQTLELRRAQYGVEVHKKFAISFACVVFVLFGAPVALRLARGGVGMAIGVSVIVFAIYWAGLIGGERLADRGRADPFLAMWAPNIAFLLVSIPLIARMGTVMSTGRGGGTLFDTLADLIRRVGRRRARGGAA